MKMRLIVTFLVFYIIVFSVLNVHAQNEFLIKKDAEKLLYESYSRW